VSESLEGRTYLTTYPTPNKLVIISDNSIIVAPGALIDTPTPDSNHPTGVMVQLQTFAGTPAAPVAGPTAVVTLSSGTINDPVFSNGSATETAPFIYPPVTASTSPPQLLGTALFSNLRIDTPGLYTLTASDNGLSASTSVEVTEPSATMSSVFVEKSSLVAGTYENVAFQPVDDFGNDFNTTVPSIAWSLVPGSGTSSGKFGASSTNPDDYTGLPNSGGTAFAGFYATAAGTPVQIDVKANGMLVTSTLPTIQVTQPIASPAKSTISVGQPVVAAGDTAFITLRTEDSDGNDLTSGGLPVVFETVSGAGTSDGTIGAVTDNGDGTYTASFTGTTAGSPVKIEATVQGLLVTSTLPTITVTPGPLSPATCTINVAQPSVVAGATDTITVQSRDAYDNILTTGGATVNLNIVPGSGTSAGSLGNISDNGNGTYTCTFTASTVGTPIQIEGTVNGAAVTGLPPTIEVVADSVSPAQSTITVAQADVVAGNPDVVTLRAVDASGNDWTSGGLAVAFKVLSGNGTSNGVIGPVTENDNGTYTATFTASTGGNPVKISAIVNGTTVTTILPTITVQTGSIDPSNSVISVSPAKVVSGQSATITLQTTDVAGNDLSTGGATVVFSMAGSGTSGGMIGPVTDNFNGTYTATFTASTPGTPIQIAATVNGVAVAMPSPNVTVVAGPIDPANSTVTSTAVVLGETTTISLQAVDDEGNNVTTGGATVVFDLSGAMTESVPAKDNGDGTYTGSFIANTLGSIQITPIISSTTASDPLLVNVSSIATGILLPSGFIYRPGRAIPVKIYNFDPTASAIGPFMIQLGLSKLANGSDPIDVGTAGTFNGDILPNQSRAGHAGLGVLPSVLDHGSKYYLVATVTDGSGSGFGVTSSPVLTPAVISVTPHKPIRVKPGAVIKFSIRLTNTGYTGSVPYSGTISQLVLGVSADVATPTPVLGSGGVFKIASGGFNGKSARGVAYVHLAVPGIVGTVDIFADVSGAKTSAVLIGVLETV
jgi:adhesin/invasin